MARKDPGNKPVSLKTHRRICICEIFSNGLLGCLFLWRLSEKPGTATGILSAVGFIAALAGIAFSVIGLRKLRKASADPAAQGPAGEGS